MTIRTEGSCRVHPICSNTLQCALPNPALHSAVKLFSVINYFSREGHLEKNPPSRKQQNNEKRLNWYSVVIGVFWISCFFLYLALDVFVFHLFLIYEFSIFSSFLFHIKQLWCCMIYVLYLIYFWPMNLKSILSHCTVNAFQCTLLIPQLILSWPQRRIEMGFGTELK